MSTVPRVLQTAGVLLALSVEHTADAEHISGIHPEHAVNREIIQSLTIRKVLTPSMSWAIANVMPSVTKRQLPASRQVMLSTEGTADATCATSTENCAVNMVCTAGCEDECTAERVSARKPQADDTASVRAGPSSAHRARYNSEAGWCLAPSIGSTAEAALTWCSKLCEWQKHQEADTNHTTGCNHKAHST